MLCVLSKSTYIMLYLYGIIYLYIFHVYIVFSVFNVVKTMQTQNMQYLFFPHYYISLVTRLVFSDFCQKMLSAFCTHCERGKKEYFSFSSNPQLFFYFLLCPKLPTARNLVEECYKHFFPYSLVA
jgi:flagellar biosynthesis protein FliQ